jgi:hypothetical protein
MVFMLGIYIINNRELPVYSEDVGKICNPDLL